MATVEEVQEITGLDLTGATVDDEADGQDATSIAHRLGTHRPHLNSLSLYERVLLQVSSMYIMIYRELHSNHRPYWHSLCRS